MKKPLLSNILDFIDSRRENVNVNEKELITIEMIECELFHHHYFDVQLHLLELEAPSELITTLWNYICEENATEFVPPTSILKRSPVDTLSADEFLSEIPVEAIDTQGAVLFIDLSACPEKVTEVVEKALSIFVAHRTEEYQEMSEEWTSQLLPGIAEFLVKEGESIRTR